MEGLVNPMVTLGAGVVFLRLLLSMILGGIIGAEREWRNQPAGLRTHLILSLGAALATIVSIELGNRYGSDPTRIAANIVTGVGFLGAGAILRLGISVRGLTTAASLWTTAGIGMAVGAGMYWGAFVAAAFLLVGLIILRHVESLFLPGKGAKTLYVTGRSTPEFLRDLERAVESHGAKFISLDFRRDRARDRLEVRAILDSPPDSRPIDLSNALRGLDAITEVEIR